MPHYNLDALRRVMAAGEPLPKLTVSFADNLPNIKEKQKKRQIHFKYTTVGDFSYDIKRRAKRLAEGQQPLYKITIKTDAETSLSFKVLANDQLEYILSRDSFVPCEDSSSILVEGDKMAASVCEEYFTTDRFLNILQVLSEQHHVPTIFVLYLAAVQINQYYHLSHWHIRELKNLLAYAMPKFSSEQSEIPGEGEKTKISSMLSNLTVEPYQVEIDVPNNRMIINFCGTTVTVDGTKYLTDLDLDQLEPMDQHLDLSEEALAQYVKEKVITEIDGQLFQTEFWLILAEEAKYKLRERNENVGRNNEQKKLTVNDLRALFFSAKTDEHLSSLVTDNHQLYAFFLLETKCFLTLRKFLHSMFVGGTEQFPDVPAEFIEDMTTILAEGYDQFDDYAREQAQADAVSLAAAAAQEEEFVLVYPKPLGRSKSCPTLFFGATAAQKEDNPREQTGIFLNPAFVPG